VFSCAYLFKKKARADVDHSEKPMAVGRLSLFGLMDGKRVVESQKLQVAAPAAQLPFSESPADYRDREWSVRHRLHRVAEALHEVEKLAADCPPSRHQRWGISFPENCRRVYFGTGCCQQRHSLSRLHSTTSIATGENRGATPRTEAWLRFLFPANN
jgi:hypothetical protein